MTDGLVLKRRDQLSWICCPHRGSRTSSPDSWLSLFFYFIFRWVTLHIINVSIKKSNIKSSNVEAKNKLNNLLGSYFFHLTYCEKKHVIFKVATKLPTRDIRNFDFRYSLSLSTTCVYVSVPFCCSQCDYNLWWTGKPFPFWSFTIKVQINILRDKRDMIVF